MGRRQDNGASPEWTTEKGDKDRGDETQRWPIKTGGSGGDKQMIFKQ